MKKKINICLLLVLALSPFSNIIINLADEINPSVEINDGKANSDESHDEITATTKQAAKAPVANINDWDHHEEEINGVKYEVLTHWKNTEITDVVIPDEYNGKPIMLHQVGAAESEVPDFWPYDDNLWGKQSPNITSITLPSNKVIYAKTGRFLFSGGMNDSPFKMVNLKAINNLQNLDLSLATDAGYMFSGDVKLKSLDLSRLDTSNVSDMECMFAECKELQSLDVSKFNTSKVKSMFAMFSRCEKVTSLDLSNFDTSNVRQMSEMFNSCTNLESVNLTSFDTSKVTSMENAFTFTSIIKMVLKDAKINPLALESLPQQCIYIVNGAQLQKDINAKKQPRKILFNNNNYLDKAAYLESEWNNKNNKENLVSYANSLGSNWILEATHQSLSQVVASINNVEDLVLQQPEIKFTTNDAAKTVSITFNGNGASNVMANQVIDAGKTTKINKYTFIREGYKFLGWNENLQSANQGQVQYADEAEITLQNNVVLYAVWEENNSQIVNGANNQSGDEDDLKILSPSAIEPVEGGYKVVNGGKVEFVNQPTKPTIAIPNNTIVMNNGVIKLPNNVEMLPKTDGSIELPGVDNTLTQATPSDNVVVKPTNNDCIIDAEGNITFPSGGIIIRGGNDQQLPEGCIVTPIGNVIDPSKGTITTPDGRGSLKVVDTTISVDQATSVVNEKDLISLLGIEATYDGQPVVPVISCSDFDKITQGVIGDYPVTVTLTGGDKATRSNQLANQVSLTGIVSVVANPSVEQPTTPNQPQPTPEVKPGNNAAVNPTISENKAAATGVAMSATFFLLVVGASILVIKKMNK